MHIIGVNGIEFANKSLSGMISGRVLPWVQDNTDQRVWESWEVNIRDLFVLGHEANVVDVVNLTAFNPDVRVDSSLNLVHASMSIDILNPHPS